jgi:hypothetical protein
MEHEISTTIEQRVKELNNAVLNVAKTNSRNISAEDVRAATHAFKNLALADLDIDAKLQQEGSRIFTDSAHQLPDEEWDKLDADISKNEKLLSAIKQKLSNHLARKAVPWLKYLEKREAEIEQSCVTTTDPKFRKFMLNKQRELEPALNEAILYAGCIVLTHLPTFELGGDERIALGIKLLPLASEYAQPVLLTRIEICDRLVGAIAFMSSRPYSEAEKKDFMHMLAGNGLKESKPYKQLKQHFWPKIRRRESTNRWGGGYSGGYGGSSVCF